MAKATTTIQQTLTYQPHHGDWLAANQALFNRVASFYFDVIQAHCNVLDHPNKEALTILELLTHTTQRNSNPVMPLSDIAEDIPAYFRRAAIHAALGSAHSFHSHLEKWKQRKEKAIAKGKTFHVRPPVPPRAWNKSVTLYQGMWKDRTDNSIMIKVWTGTCWSWINVRITGRELPLDAELGSPQLIRKGTQWWLHTPVEKQFQNPGKIEKQVTTNLETKICAVDLNISENIAVCTVQTVEGTILATKFIKGGDEISGFRKRQLGRIARNRRKTSIIAKGEQDNIALWKMIRQVDEQCAHRISARIVQFAKQHEASILVFEHLGNLRPAKGMYSRRGNTKRAYWMRGRIFTYAKYKAYNTGIVTSRVSPRNTSRECAYCHNLIARYNAGKPAEGYTPGAPLAACGACGMKGNADRNASLVIGQRLIERYHPKEKPQALRRVSKDTGVIVSQDAKNKKEPSIPSVRHADSNEHGTAQDVVFRMDEHASDIPTQLRLFNE
ncbi:zinc ribbon domain-containing protein [Dictyobacter aurantiacus]|uniref:Cas12f1-like TNB domain-containing protein n=1 Tax=Dictyobacter aurantiacus TaxID=1936993 RepID=A0A401ZQM8_9CHLR|nr:zinc ribbon domain-containing protein [Dictyobacter aurantiacus]GCE09171.1 hypothetical protein KDAU_65000 [Dictyobacter aurantiacus]